MECNYKLATSVYDGHVIYKNLRIGTKSAKLIFEVEIEVEFWSKFERKRN